MVIGLVGGSLGILIVALAPDITILLVGWCIAQLLFNALLAAVVAVLPDQVPIGQRGLIAGILGVGMPIASVSATFLVKLFTGNELAMFLVPCAIAGCFILLFVVTLNDRRLAREDKPAWSLREIASTFYVNPRKSPDGIFRHCRVLLALLLAVYHALRCRVSSHGRDSPSTFSASAIANSNAQELKAIHTSEIRQNNARIPRPISSPTNNRRAPRIATMMNATPTAVRSPYPRASRALARA